MALMSIAQEGQLVGESSGTFRHWHRRGCGSTLDVCGSSHKEPGVLPGMLTYCDLCKIVRKPIEIIDEASGKPKVEVVSIVFCGAGEKMVAVSQ